jgi:hypothetical protein
MKDIKNVIKLKMDCAKGGCYLVATIKIAITIAITLNNFSCDLLNWYVEFLNLMCKVLLFGNSRNQISIDLH